MIPAALTKGIDALNVLASPVRHHPMIADRKLPRFAEPILYCVRVLELCKRIAESEQDSSEENEALFTLKNKLREEGKQ